MKRANQLHSKSVTKRSEVALLLCARPIRRSIDAIKLIFENKQHPVSESVKNLYSKGISFEDHYFVVAALCKSVCIWAK